MSTLEHAIDSWDRIATDTRSVETISLVLQNHQKVLNEICTKVTQRPRTRSVTSDLQKIAFVMTRLKTAEHELEEWVEEIDFCKKNFTRLIR